MVKSQKSQIPEFPKFKNQDLLRQALTHRSYANEHPEIGSNNERLEFLGDAVLGHLVGKMLYDRYQEMSEAELTRLRSALVNCEQLAQLAISLGIHEKMLLGKGADKDGGRQNPSLLSDTFEAVIGAYYLDSNITSLRSFIDKLFKPIADQMVFPQGAGEIQVLVDSKNRFQQWALAHHGENPEYIITDESGPPHAKEFTAEVHVKGTKYGVGYGNRKQDAEKQAAEIALEKLGLI